MSSIVYCGHDFSPYVQAEVLEPVGRAVSARTAAVPGRPGLVLFDGDVEPLTLRVRLLWDGGLGLGPVGRSSARHVLYSWLLCPTGGELELPDWPYRRYRDVLCTDAGDWSTLFEDGSAVVEFTCFDPIAYGAWCVWPRESFRVMGTWPTLPSFELVADGSGPVCVSNATSGGFVRIASDFAAGTVVAVDCATETVSVDGEDATADVELGSNFFALEPGDCALAYEGCSSYTVRFWERWA